MWEAPARAAARLRACGGRDRLVTGSRDSSQVQAKRGRRDGPSPVDRGRPGSKHHLIVDAGGLPLAWTLTGGNRNDVTQLLPLLDASRRCAAGSAGRFAGPSGAADRGYDHDQYRRQLRQRGIRPQIARRGAARLRPRHAVRWVVERTSPGYTTFKRLLVRYDRRDEIHEAFLAIACCLVCHRRLASL